MTAGRVAPLEYRELGMVHTENHRVVPVSAVIPCYRCSMTLARALRSVAKQTTRPAEVLLVEDGSGDGTEGVATSFSEKYPAGWIRMIRLKENQGPANARNVGWDAAQFPFIAFLDADDAWHPQKIEIQYNFMVRHPDVAICGHRHDTIRQNSAYSMAVEVEEGQKEIIGRVAMLLSNRFITPSVMLRRDLPLRFEAGRRHMEDHLLWMRAACAGYRVVRLETPLAGIFKAPYGSGGLSSELWQMERGSLSNYLSLRRDGCIGWIGMVLLMGYSLLKYCRRLAIVGMRRWLTADRPRRGGTG